MTYQRALEIIEDKQIPKKPLVENVQGNYVVLRDFCCPACGNKIISFCDDEFFAGKKQNFCDNCGQALDWSELSDL